MATWKKVIVSGSNAELNTLNVGVNQQISSSVSQTFLSGSFSGSFEGSLKSSLTNITQPNIVGYDTATGLFYYQGTGSFTATTASYITGSGVYGPYGSNSILSASYAVTAGYAANVPDTASYALQALTASYSNTSTTAQTASYVLNAVSSSYSTFAATAGTANTASYVLNAVSSSYSTFAATAGTANTASYVLNAISASYATTASFASNLASGLNITASNLLVTNNLAVNGTASFNYVEQITGSAVIIGQEYIILNTQSPASRFAGLVIYDSGSNSHTASLVWDSVNDHFIYENASGSTYSGGMFIAGPKNTGSLGEEIGLTQWRVPVAQGDDHIMDSQIYSSGSTTIITGSLTVTAGITGSLLGTSSYATQALTASYANTATSSSYALTASYASNVPSTASYALQALTASYANTATTAQTASYVLQAVSSSYSTYAATAGTANTASYVLNAQTASYVLNAVSSSYSTYAATAGTANTASYVLNAVSASYATTSSYALSSSYALNASTASNIGPAVVNNNNNYILTATGNGNINGESNLTFDGSTLTVTGNTVVSGDLTVAGTASFSNQSSLLVADKFILLASGSNTLTDAGIIAAAGGLSGSAWYLEAGSAGSTGTYGRWAVAYNLHASASAAVVDEYAVTAKLSAASAPSNSVPPTWGSGSNGGGNIWIKQDTGDIYIWA